MATLARLVLKVSLDDDDYVKAVRKVERSTSNLGETMERAGARLLPLTAALTAAGAASVKLAVDAEETRSKFTTVFGDMTGSLDQFIASVRDTIPATREQLEGMLSGLQDLLVPMGVVPQAAAEMSQEFTQLAADLASFNNIPLSEALDALRSGLVGESEPLRRFGVDVRQTAVQMKALELGLLEAGEAMTNQARAQAVLAIATEESTFAIGDAARTADSAANQFKFLRRDVVELATELGRELIPIVRDLLGAIRPVIRGFVDMSDEAKRTTVIVAGLVAGLGPALIVVGSLTRAFRELAVAITAVNAAGGAGGLAGLTARFGKLIGPGGVIAAGGLAAIAIIKGMADAWNRAADDAVAAGRAFDQAIQSVSPQRAEQLIEALKGDIQSLKADEARLAQNLQSALAAGNDQLAASLRQSLGTVRDNLRATSERIRTLEGVVNSGIAAMDELTATVSGPDGMSGGLDEAADSAARLSQELRDTVNAISALQRATPLPDLRFAVPDISVPLGTGGRRPGELFGRVGGGGGGAGGSGGGQSTLEEQQRFIRSVLETASDVRIFGGAIGDAATQVGLFDQEMSRAFGSAINAVSGFAQGLAAGGPLGALVGALPGFVGFIEAFANISVTASDRLKEFAEGVRTATGAMQVQFTLLSQDTERLRQIFNDLGADLVGKFVELGNRLTETAQKMREFADAAVAGEEISGLTDAGLLELFEQTRGDPFEAAVQLLDTGDIQGLLRVLEELEISFLDIQDAGRALGLDVSDLLQVLITGEGDTAAATAQLRLFIEAMIRVAEAANTAADQANQARKKFLGGTVQPGPGGRGIRPPPNQGGPILLPPGGPGTLPPGQVPLPPSLPTFPSPGPVQPPPIEEPTKPFVQFPSITEVQADEVVSVLRTISFHSERTADATEATAQAIGAGKLTTTVNQQLADEANIGAP